MIPKPGKDKTQPPSHNTLPSHQFGFQAKHGAIEQVNRITTEIRAAFEHREFST